MSEGTIPSLPPVAATDLADPPAPRGGLRERVARGTVVNAIFLIALSSLGLVKGFVVAAFLTRHDYGVWGMLVVAIGLLGWLKQVGVSDKYVQQTETDQELAFQRAFTLEVLFSAIFLVLALIVVPLIALAYGRSELLTAGLVSLLVVPAGVLQFPLWIFYRRMEFVQQRTLQAIDPIVEFVVTVALAVAGLGYWSLVIGLLAGNYATALVVMRRSPYRLAWRYDRGALRRYVQFSWPLVVAGAGGIVVAQSTVFIGGATLGLAGVGAIALASSIVLYTTRVDEIVTSTMYPAICAVRDRTDLLFESFVKSNRLGLMWGVPLGVGIALFASDLVHYGLGERWRPAVGLISVFGLIAAADQLGYNWDAYYRARAQTRPIATVSIATMLVFVAVAIPLLVTDGLEGLGIGMAAAAATGIAGRAFYLVKMFDGFAIVRHAAHAAAPVLPAAAAVLALRAIDGHRSLAIALAEIALYVVIAVVATLVLERSLLRELAGSLRGVKPAADAIA
jgi:O-antigen/teichoic acid export membrane protein